MIARKAMGIAAEICVYTNTDLTVESVGGQGRFAFRHPFPALIAAS